MLAPKAPICVASTRSRHRGCPSTRSSVGRQRERPQRLQRVELLEVRRQEHGIGDGLEVLDVQERRVRVKRRRDDVAEARHDAHRLNVVGRDRTSAVAMGEQQHRKARRRVGPQRCVAVLHHVGNAPAGRQRVIRSRIGRARRMADHDDVGKGSSGGRAEHVVIVGYVDRYHRRVRRVRQEVGGAALRAVRARHAFPIRRRVLTRREAAEILRQVAAFDRIGARQRERRNRDGMRLLLREQGERECGERRRACRAPSIGLPRVAVHNLPMRCCRTCIGGNA